MTDITIPPEALENAARAMCGEVTRPEPTRCPKACPDCLAEARAACLAMLRAWPGNRTETEYFTGRGDYWEPAIILPLTENTDAE